MRALNLALLLTCSLSGCVADDDGNTVCTPGVTQACVCPGGIQGAQSCNADGKSWGSCEGCSVVVPDAQVLSPDLPSDDGSKPDGTLADLVNSDAAKPDDAGHDLLETTYYITDHTATLAEVGMISGQTLSGWTLEATKLLNGGINTHAVTLTSNTSATRACTLKFKVAISRTGLVWLNTNLINTKAVGTTGITNNWVGQSYQNHLGPNMHRHPFVLWGGMQNSTTRYALAVDPLTPAVFEMEYNAATQEFYVLFRLGFHTSVRTATVKFHYWEEPATPEGARKIVEKVQNVIAPTAYADKIRTKGFSHGSWGAVNTHTTFPTQTTLSDFGIKILQGTGSHSATNLAKLEGWGVARVRYTYGYELHHYNMTNLDDRAAVLQQLQTRAASGDIRALASLNAGAYSTANNLIHYYTTSGWVPGVLQVVPNPAPGIRPEPNHYNSEVAQHYATLRSLYHGMMIDNHPFFYWHIDAKVGEKTRMDYQTKHFQYMDTPLSFDTTFKVAVNYDMMATEFVRGCQTWAENESSGQLVWCNSGIYASNFSFHWQDGGGFEAGVWRSGGVWAPTSYEYLLGYRIKLGKKPVSIIVNPAAWDTWTNSMTTRTLARYASLGIFWLPGLSAQTPDGFSTSAYFNIPEYVERDRAVFKKYMPIIQTLSHAGWEPVRNFSLSDSTIWGERFGDIAGANKTVYITVFNPSTTSSRTFTLSSATYSTPAPATFTELISNTSRAWTTGNLSITLAPETVQIFRLTYN